MWYNPVKHFFAGTNNEVLTPVAFVLSSGKYINCDNHTLFMFCFCFHSHNQVVPRNVSSCRHPAPKSVLLYVFMAIVAI